MRGQHNIASQQPQFLIEVCEDKPAAWGCPLKFLLSDEIVYEEDSSSLLPSMQSHVSFVDAPFIKIITEAPSIFSFVHERHHLSASADIREKMAEWEINKEAYRFGKHTYSLERYGLTEMQMREQFGDYYARFSDFV